MCVVLTVAARGPDPKCQDCRDVVVIGGSAGALEPLKEIVSELPPDLPAAIVVVIHVGPTQPSMLAPILSRAGGPPAVMPKEGDPVTPGYVYVATPNRHLEVTPEGFRLSLGPRVNAARPAVDVLFQSAAETYGPRTIGVVLSGGLDDGSAGLAAIREAGGVGIVQQPEDAVVAAMPRNAIQRAQPEHVAPASALARLIVQAVDQPAPHAPLMARRGGPAMPGEVGARDIDGTVTGLTCPECHGAIWMHSDPGKVTFQCRVGHSLSPESFFEIQSENVENALWAGVRSLEEQASFAQVMADRVLKSNDDAARERYEARRRLATSHAEVLRKVLTGRD